MSIMTIEELQREFMHMDYTEEDLPLFLHASEIAKRFAISQVEQIKIEEIHEPVVTEGHRGWNKAMKNIRNQKQAIIKALK